MIKPKRYTKNPPKQIAKEFLSREIAAGRIATQAKIDAWLKDVAEGKTEKIGSAHEALGSRSKSVFQTALLKSNSLGEKT